MTRIIWGAKFAGLALVATALAGCSRAADMSCAELATKATEISQEQPVKIVRVNDVKEVSKTDKERRCSGVAETSAGTNETVILRGYEENGNQIVKYEGQGDRQ